MSKLTDLNELVGKCYDERTREILREAVDCYNCGSFRAAIVMTWIAVVFDYFYKLEELGQKGEKDAKSESDSFFQANEKLDKAALQQFENTLLDQARDHFGFITQTQAYDLDRLYNDRHRSAHPRITAGHEAYKPSAEQARYHLKSAVDILLSFPPRMGKAGIDEIWNFIESQSFPLELEKAKEALRNTNLDRLRPEAQKDLALQLFITPICESLSDTVADRIASAANALVELKPTLLVELQAKINKKIANLSDEQRARIYRVMFVSPSFKGLLNKAELDKCIEFAKHLDPQNPHFEIVYAANQPEFVPSISKLIPRVSNDCLAGIITLNAHTTFREEALKRLDDVINYNQADLLMEELLIPCAQFFTEAEIKQILYKTSLHSQIKDTKKASSLFVEFFRNSENKLALKGEWQTFATNLDWSRLQSLADAL